MDREDARLVARVLKCRVDGSRVELEQLAASSLMQLSTCATLIANMNIIDPWAPATAAATEIMAIVRLGGAALDQPRGLDHLDHLAQFAASMEKLAGEAPAVNRAQRRANHARLARPQRKPLFGIGKPQLVRH